MTRFDHATVASTTSTFWSDALLDHQGSTDTLDRYGAQGWELVDVLDIDRQGGGSREVVAVSERAS